jgi:hypothetical protein
MNVNICFRRRSGEMGMKVWKALVAVVVVLALAGAAAWHFRFDVIILIARAKQPKVEVNHAVSWAQGPARRRRASGRRTWCSSWPTTSATTTSP